MAKGAEFERETARDLSEWLTGERNPPVLWRTTLSGGWQHRGEADVGDISPKGDSPEGQEFRSHFGVECKHRKEIPWWGVWSHTTPDVEEWWEKLSVECSDEDLCPLLIMKQNFYPTMVGFPPGLLPLNPSIRWMTLHHLGLSFMKFETFLDEYDPQELYGYVNEWRNDN